MGLKRKIYIMYRGENVVAHGTIYEIAEFMKVRPQTVLFYSYPVHRARNKGGNHLEAYFIGYEEMS